VSLEDVSRQCIILMMAACMFGLWNDELNAFSKRHL